MNRINAEQFGYGYRFYLRSFDETLRHEPQGCWITGLVSTKIILRLNNVALFLLLAYGPDSGFVFVFVLVFNLFNEMFKYNSFEIIYYDGAHPMKLLQLSASILWNFCSYLSASIQYTFAV